MSKLYFRYGAMNCGKSSALMQVAYNYEQNNKKVIVIKSEIDTKGNNYLESRIGLKRKVDILLKENESKDVVIKSNNNVTFTFEKGTMKGVEGKENYDFSTIINSIYSDTMPSYEESPQCDSPFYVSLYL